MSMEQVTLADLLEHFTKDDLNSLGIKYVANCHSNVLYSL